MDGALLLYSLDDEQSLDVIEAWIKLVRSHGKPDLKMIIIANKADLGTEENELLQKGRNLSEANLALFTFICALETDKVHNAFQLIVDAVKRTNKFAFEPPVGPKDIQKQGEVIRVPSIFSKICCQAIWPVIS